MLAREDNELLTRVGPGTAMGVLMRRFWQPALLSEEIPVPDCPPVRVRLLGEDLIAFRDSAGRPGLLGAQCPHRRAPLFFGRNEGGGLRCVYHGWKFDVSGHCLEMPNVPPESDFKAKVEQLAYPCVERGGIVWAYMGPAKTGAELPDLEFLSVPADHRYVTKYLIRCNYMQGMEGDLDSSHLSFLHASVDPQAHIIRHAGTDTAPRITVRDTDGGLLIGARRDADPARYYWRLTQWLFPIYTMLNGESRTSSSAGSLLCNIRVPIDDHHHWFVRVKWRSDRPMSSTERREYETGGGLFAERIPGTYLMRANIDNDYLIDREMQRTLSYSGIVGVPVEDAAMVEGMTPISDRTQEHLGVADIAVVHTRRRLLDAARELQGGIEPYAATHAGAYRVRSATTILDHGIDFQEGAAEALKSWQAVEADAAKRRMSTGIPNDIGKPQHGLQAGSSES